MWAYRIKKLISQAGDYLSGWIVFVFSAISILFTICTLSLSLTYVAWTSNQEPYPVYKSLTFFFLNFLVPNPKLADHKILIESLSLVLNTLFFLVSFLFAVAPVLVIFKHKKELKKSKSIKPYRIYRDGVDDQKIMKDYYRNAEELIVYSGDFSWVATNRDLREEIIRLSNVRKITLVSYKSENVVKSGVSDEDLFRILIPCFVFDYKQQIKCSYIKRGGSSYFLYKFESMLAGETVSHVYVLTDSHETRYLLEILGKFCTHARKVY